jgi:exodeoxyribonuclease VII small subunit
MNEPCAPDACAPGGEALSFEEALDQLETIVARLEAGSLSLGEALERFEEGIRLSRHCTQRLEDAEAKIEVLMREGGQLQSRPFHLDLDEDEE